MKLLNCLDCEHIVSINPFEWVVCRCGKSKAIYLADHITVSYVGNARILGISNISYDDSLQSRDYKVDYEWWVIDPNDPVLKKLED